MIKKLFQNMRCSRLYAISFIATMLSVLPIEGKTKIDALANPDATKETKALYKRLCKAYGKQCLTATMAEVNWNNANADRVATLTGQSPAINCYDFIHLHFSPSNWINYDDVTPVREWHDKGGIVSAMWHWNVPIAEGSEERAFYTKQNDKPNLFRPSNCVKEGTWERKVFLEDMRKVAGHLKALQELHIPVLWRPFHEAKGNYDVYEKGKGAWFWWGSEGAEPLKAMWIEMFEYFKREGVNNLIWVFTDIPDHLDRSWYPGDEYVDIVGVDIYNKTNPKDIAEIYGNLTLLYPGKMCTLSECGSVSTLSEQWKAGARWIWAMPWYGKGHATDEWWLDAHQ